LSQIKIRARRKEKDASWKKNIMCKKKKNKKGNWRPIDFVAKTRKK
jgi:hypothetical protein